MKKHLHHVDPGSALLIIYLALMVLLVAGNALIARTDRLSGEVESAPPSAGQDFTPPPCSPPISISLPQLERVMLKKSVTEILRHAALYTSS
ncbi:MAG: hypothetical protein M0O96_00280 [Desulforhopalus sp.]|nr:hypothetical protein [Desulforhopalus sp.]